MHKVKRKKRRITVTLSVANYKEFHVYAVNQKWSDDRAGGILLMLALGQKREE